MAEIDVQIDEKIKQEITEPSKYKVIFLNDELTPMDWVIDILQRFFKHSRETAENLTLTIHHDGSAVVGIYTCEIAEQKATEATFASRDQGFPLQIRVEKE